MQSRPNPDMPMVAIVWLPYVAHAVFGAASVYFTLLFFHAELSLSFFRYLGVTVTLWAALGSAFDYALHQAKKTNPWLSGLNITFLGAGVLLCVFAMANHSNLPLHTLAVHGVLSLSLAWNVVGYTYYRRRSRLWTEWYSALRKEDQKVWLVYLASAYWPFLLPLGAQLLQPADGANLNPAIVESASDGITSFILFWEFFSYWSNSLEARRISRAADSDEEPTDGDVNVLDGVLSSRRVRVGCLHWPPVVECVAQRAADGTTAVHPGGFYGLWLAEVATSHGLTVECLPVAWHNMRDMLKDRKVDIVVCAFITPTRREYAEFSRPFHQCAMHGVAQAGARKWALDDVKAPDARIVIAKHEVGFEFAVSALGYSPDDPRFSVVQTNRIEEVASIVLGGTGEYVGISDGLSIAGLRKRHDASLRIILNDPSLQTYDVAIMMLKGQMALKAWVDESFTRARNTPGIVAAEAQLLRDLAPLGCFRKL